MPLNKKTIALKLLKNQRARRVTIGISISLLKNPRVRRVILKQIERWIRRR
jgi:hypothetical protein